MKELIKYLLGWGLQYQIFWHRRDFWCSRWLYQDYELMNLLLLYPVQVD